MNRQNDMTDGTANLQKTGQYVGVMDESIRVLYFLYMYTCMDTILIRVKLMEELDIYVDYFQLR
jgi:hypothetical protein